MEVGVGVTLCVARADDGHGLYDAETYHLTV